MDDILSMLNGCKEWFTTNKAEIIECYNAEAREQFDTIEDFAIELYAESKGLTVS